MAEALMSAEADAVCGAGYGQRSDEPVNRRNGYRSRDWARSSRHEPSGCRRPGRSHRGVRDRYPAPSTAELTAVLPLVPASDAPYVARLIQIAELATDQT
ncbi:Transposase, Mutator family [Actinomadura meyerae]|uniref:Transposase, Mutator family n=1 Tax=Actinomadura meyerae TaxID=240840 RepID=A0A239P3A7_9ACTN|nr:Transposase, Mutator family [Actinomadura meyerae]